MCVICGVLCSFYDHYGRPDFTKIEALLGEQQEVNIQPYNHR